LGNKHYLILISEQDGGLVYASCVWHEGDRALKAPGEKGHLDFHLEKRLGTSEEDALSQILDWVKQKFGPDYEMKERA